jgi:hypothetical protein
MGAAAALTAIAAASNGSQDAALLPPFIPACVSSAVCPLSCEDPVHPGHLAVFRHDALFAHLSVCPQRQVACMLCIPQHLVPHAKLRTHWSRDVLSSDTKREYALIEAMHTAAAAAPSADEDEELEAGASHKRRRLSA